LSSEKNRYHKRHKKIPCKEHGIKLFAGDLSFGIDRYDQRFNVF
jgi:hypothetical protein